MGRDGRGRGGDGTEFQILLQERTQSDGAWRCAYLASSSAKDILFRPRERKY